MPARRARPVGRERRGAQGTLLLIEIRATNPQPVRPTGPVNDLQEFMAAWAACWSPPPVDQSRRRLT